MKVLNTNQFIVERVKVQPVTNVQLDKAKQDIMKPVEININSVDISVFDEFGYVLRTKNKTDYITLGNINKPSYLKSFIRYLFEKDCIAISYGIDEFYNKEIVGHISKDNYETDSNGYESFFPKTCCKALSCDNIVKVFKLYTLTLDDIKTFDALKNTYKKYNLKQAIAYG